MSSPVIYPTRPGVYQCEVIGQGGSRCVSLNIEVFSGLFILVWPLFIQCFQSPPLSSPEATEGAAEEETSPVGDSSEFSHRTSLSSAISSAEDISPQVSSGWSW